MNIQVFSGQLAGKSQPITTSRIVAGVFDKQHTHVLRDIRELDCSEEFRLSNFGESAYLNEQNKRQPEYQMTRDGFMFLVMGFTGAEAARRKEAYIAAFNEMEDALRLQPTRQAQPLTPRELNELLHMEVTLPVAEYLRLVGQQPGAVAAEGRNATCWTQDEDQRLLAGIASGQRPAEIARVIGRSVNGIIHRRKLLRRKAKESA